MTRIPDLDQTPDQLQVLENQFHLGERNAHRRALQVQLKAILDDVSLDVETAVRRVHMLGFETEPGFEKKSLSAILDSVREAIELLEDECRGVANLEIDTGSPRKRIKLLNSNSGFSEVLATIIEDEYFSVDRLDAALRALPTEQKIAIPEDEKARLEANRPRKLRRPTIERINHFRLHSKFETPPMAMQLPAKILIDGTETPFSIETMKALLDSMPVGRMPASRLKIGGVDDSAVFKKTWSPNLKFWTISGIVDSTGLPYEDQLKHQQLVMGEHCEIEADVILAFVMRFLASGRSFMLKDFLRLNDQRDDGNVLEIYMMNGKINIVNSNHRANKATCIGASFSVKPDGSIQ